jgi:hypothetical protein
MIARSTISLRDISFNVFKPPKQVADPGLELEHVLFTVVLRTTYRTFCLVRFARQMGYVFVYTKRYLMRKRIRF